VDWRKGITAGLGDEENVGSSKRKSTNNNY
jgi:hypothetical protein